MNNSIFEMNSAISDKEKDKQDFFVEKEAKLIRSIEALIFIATTNEWKVLKEDLFDPLPENLERQINQEAKKETPNIQRLNRLSGELKWAERYADLEKLAQTFKVELSAVRQKLYGKTETQS